jgi:hypothetical protein
MCKTSESKKWLGFEAIFLGREVSFCRRTDAVESNLFSPAKQKKRRQKLEKRRSQRHRARAAPATYRPFRKLLPPPFGSIPWLGAPSNICSNEARPRWGHQPITRLQKRKGRKTPGRVTSF